MKAVLALLGSILKLDRFAGYRTYVGAIGLAGLAVSQFANGQYDQAATSIGLALIAVGLHDKKPDAVVVVAPPADAEPKG